MWNQFPSVCQQMTRGTQLHLTNVQAEQRLKPVHILHKTITCFLKFFFRNLIYISNLYKFHD